jgi:hypothetical protein
LKAPGFNPWNPSSEKTVSKFAFSNVVNWYRYTEAISRGCGSPPVPAPAPPPTADPFVFADDIMDGFYGLVVLYNLNAVDP